MIKTVFTSAIMAVFLYNAVPSTAAFAWETP